MKVGKKKFLLAPGVLAFGLILLFLVPVFAQDEMKKAAGFAPEEEVIGGGDLSDSVSWTMTEDEQGNMTLYIDGIGPMPDFKNSAGQPWREWLDSTFTLVVGDGVTRIGDCNMSGLRIKEVHIGEGVEAIGKKAFSYGYSLEHITIPGNVKRIEDSAFLYHYNLQSVTFEEGVEELGQYAFGSQARNGSVFHIPASMVKIADLACWPATGYTVEEDNPCYMAVDGILYDKTMSALVDYPKYKTAAEYRIPETVCEIKFNALQRIASLRRLYIPSTVQIIQEADLLRWSSVEELYIDDGVPFNGITCFYGCGKLSKVRLPENIEIPTLLNTFSGGCNSLESLKIPSGVQKIEGIGWPTNALNQIIYDAKNAVILDRQMVDSNIRYELMIGENVDHLPAEFKWFSAQAEEILFQGPKEIFVEEGAFVNCMKPVCNLKGNIYVDEQGVVYQYDAEAEEAKVVYCQKGFSEIYIPGIIVSEEGVPCKVIGIDQDAFCRADGLKSVVFEKTEQIQFIKPYGFAHCESLSQINGIETLEDVKEVFNSVGTEIGYRAFYETGLSNKNGAVDALETMESCSELVVDGGNASDMKVSILSEGGTMNWEEMEPGSGMYTLLTGDRMNVSVNVGNTDGEEDSRYRVYFQWSDDDCNLSVQAGNTYYLNDQKVICSGTEDPNTVYIEFVPQIGKTISIPVTAVYPSPSSDGGSLAVWALILEKEAEDNTEGKLLLSENGAIRAVWKTKREEYSVTKTSTGSSSILLCGNSSGDILPNRELSWNILLKRVEDETSVYGKDYVRCVNYKDVMTLQEGIIWNPDVVSEVKAGRIRRNGNEWYAGEARICSLSLSGGQLNLSSVGFSWDEEAESVVLSYKVTNTAKDAQISTNTITYILYPDALRGDMEVLSAGETRQVENRVEAVVQYDHSAEYMLTSKASKTITASSGTIELMKQTVTVPRYFGEPVDYKIEIKNSGAMPYVGGKPGTWVLRDILSPYSYLSIDDMVRMFEEDDSKSMTITVKNVETGEWLSQAGSYENSIYWQNSFNHGENRLELAAEQIRVGWNEAGTGIQAECAGEVYEEDTLSNTLMEAGYAPGRWAEYIIEWPLNSLEETFSLKPGENRSYSVYATAKDTFLMLSKDWPNSYPTEDALTLTNTAQLLMQDGKVCKSWGVGNQVKREAYIDKYLYANKTILQDGFSVDDGTELSYTVKFTHYGKGTYNNLPIVDEMYGAQALLVPVTWNSHLSDRNLEIHEMNGEEYYILTEGTYSDVRVGGEEDFILIASNVTVEKVEKKTVIHEEQLSGEEDSLEEKTYEFNGLCTRIEWKFPNLPSGTYSLYLNYHALVMQKLAGENVYTIGNKVWVNDKIDSRIIASLWGGGTVIDFDKEILREKGATWKNDVVNREDYSLLSAGDKVTYRLSLESNGAGTYVVSGTDIADMLPQHGNVKKWMKNENVTLSYESTHESTKIENLNQWTINDTWGGQTKEGQQYMLWTDETKIRFSEQHAKVYLYVTLTYPGKEEGQDSWYDYCQSVNGDILVNTFYVYHFPANVTHHLNEPGQILLQKGVYGTSYGSNEPLIETPNRNYYNNKDSAERQIIYYMVLYNGGTKNWYLDDIYDKLPAGLTWKWLVNDALLEKTGDGTVIQTLSDFDGNHLVDCVQNLSVSDDIVYRNATVRMKDIDADNLCFQIDPGKDDTSVAFDEEKKVCYLRKNEAIVFGYVCDIGASLDTEDVMTNTAVMKYTDYPVTGVWLVEEDTMKFSGRIDQVHVDQNDGECLLATGKIIEQQFGVGESITDETWILSDVSVRRGEIIPGLTKYTEAYTMPGSGLKTEYVNRVGPQDTVHWKVRIHNSGTLSISNYTLKDILPVPYVFDGTIAYTIYDYNGNAIKTYELLSFSDRNDESVVITNNNSKKEISLNGEIIPIQISQNGTGSLRMEKGEDGSEILTIHFTDYSVSVPEGGYIDIQLSSYNPTTTYKNTVYMNQAEFIPNEQKFTSVSQGTGMKNEEKQLYGVKSSSPVTVNFGYGTSSEKTVREKDKEDNSATSMADKNYIVLTSKESSFSYQLTVTNDTEKGMEKLVFIDNLSDVGDGSPFHAEASRNSEFSVRLAEEPNVSVRILEKDGTIRELAEDKFKVEYSEKTVFSEADWNGTSIWDGSEELAKSIRVVMNDESGTVIPPDAKAEVSFDCCIHGDAKPGQMGWNSFGYHYKLKDIDQELEAMPLPVGVKIPEIPVFEKELIDVDGMPFAAREDVSFNFLIYAGEKKEILSHNLDDFRKQLENEQIPYLLEAVEIKAGQNCSGPITLEGLDWKEGIDYHIVEFLTDTDYQFQNFNHRNGETYTFEYDQDKDITITCTNVNVEKGFEFPSTGSTGTLWHRITGIALMIIVCTLSCYRRKKNGGSFKVDRRNIKQKQ